ncbi:GNAT family N-acetyltransferase [Luteipulveratus sp. YIM 133132]|uniref:GNAT family N-acetyltransferase n=1 Tax=Luteipulveratus flavus TaxID=3031728 RepID=UPI0023AF9034|nr:GNAT family N-acetyltransferase [Luteipulveratus sp. YIM 133132]MDE9367218.1 GNAT family N-acetyltransferase [Luteipulveratus sp. YIM 133132]
MSRDLPAGWSTDLAILALKGAVVDDRGDHLVVTTPGNPRFHWGNFVLVTDPAAADDAARWMSVFEDAFPHAGWRAIGLTREPGNRTAWTGLGLDLEQDEVLTASTLPRMTPLADGYLARALVSDDDWSQRLRRDVEENDISGVHDPDDFLRFSQDQVRTQRAMSEDGTGAWFGAFDTDGVLVADLGIVSCGRRARYQSVGTQEAHRRRGLAAHLLGVAARWAAERGCEEWVIVTGSENPAGRVYRSVGFEPAAASTSAYRPPPR